MEPHGLLIRSYIDLFKASIAYISLVILLPAFIIKPIAKDRSIYTKIMMYLVAGNFILMTLTFVLSFFGIFNRTMLIISLILLSIIVRFLLSGKSLRQAVKPAVNTMASILSGKYGLNLFLQRRVDRFKRNASTLIKALFKNKTLEWIIFAAICAYSVYVYNYANYTLVSFAFPDVEVHLYWIQSLIEGNIFPSGVYPHLMHNVFAAVITFFNFDAIVFIKAIGVFISILIFTMLYFGLRLVFNSKSAVLVAFFIYCVLNIYVDAVHARFQTALPQEYCMFLLIPMGLFLYNYFKSKKMWDLVFFGISLSLMISSHFYTAIIALLICLSYGIIHIKTIIKDKLIVRLLLCGVASLIVAVLPMVIGVALGKGIEQSMAWAIGIMQDNTPDIIEISNSTAEINSGLSLFVKNSIEYMSMNFLKTSLLSVAFVILLAAATLFSIVSLFIKKLREKYIKIAPYMLLLCMLIFMGVSHYLDLPEIIIANRVFYYTAYFSPFLIAMPFEIVFNISENQRYRQVFSYATLLLIPLFLTGMAVKHSFREYHSMIYFQTKGAMLTDIHLIENYEKETWTVVSPINDMSVVMHDGYHFELSEFIYEQELWDENTVLTIPTKYVFIYIEKIPRVNNTVLEYTGYAELKERFMSQPKISLEAASQPLGTRIPPRDVYTTYRNTLMSRAYYWAEEYRRFFPEEMNVYYEDDETIIYRIIQNEYALNNLAIDYGFNSAN